MKPSVLVLMSTYNGEAYVAEQIDSILNQKHVNVTLSIRDDGSTDKTYAILQDYANRYNNIMLQSGDNIGYAASFWTLLLQSTAEYSFYAFSDQDDIWDDTKLASAIYALEQYSEQYKLYASALRVVDEQLTEQYVNTFPRLQPTLGSAITRPRLSGCTMVFNPALFSLCQSFDIRNTDGKCLAHDVAVYLTTLACGGKLIFSTKSYIRLRRHAKTVTGHGKSVFKRAATVLNIFTTRRREAYHQAEFLRNHLDAHLSPNSLALLDTILAYPTSFKRTLALCLDKRIKCQVRSVDLVNIFAVLFRCY